MLFPATLCLAITRQSLWIDEGFTVWFASHKSIASFFSALVGSPGAPGDPQMLFYLFYMWGWVKLFGVNEVALRAANIPFAVLIMATMSWASKSLLREANLWVFFCLSPFFWFYLNEARPYVALMAFSGVAIVSLLAYLMDPDQYRAFAPWCCLIALFLAWGTQIMAAFLFPSMAVLTAAAATGDLNVSRNFLRDWCKPVFLCSPAFVALGIFYIWASALGVNKVDARPGLSNLAYVLYEFLGFGGLGPPRNDIRKTPHLSVFVPYWPWLLIGVVILFGLGITLFRSRPPRIVWYLAASLFLGAAIALKISMIEGFQLLGRHLAAFFPLFLITLMLWPKHSFPSRRGRLAATTSLVALALAWGTSDARLVFLTRYDKDSYRDASSIALERARLDGGRILWAADPHTAHYYGIQVVNGHHSAEIGENDGIDWCVKNQAIDARNWSSDEVSTYLDASTTPTILVLSKADLFDKNGAWSTIIKQRAPNSIARLTAFSIYEWQ